MGNTMSLTLRSSSLRRLSGEGVRQVAIIGPCSRAGGARKPGAKVTTAASSPSKKAATLYERRGGAPAISATVDVFYEKVMADDRINYFFHGVDMKKQRVHQAAFLTFVTGGSSSYGRNLNMRAAHQRLIDELGLQIEHFDVVLELLGHSLIDLHVTQEDVAEAAAIVETLRPSFQMAINRANA